MFIKNRTPRDPLTPVEAIELQRRRRLSILLLASVIVLVFRRYQRSLLLRQA